MENLVAPLPEDTEPPPLVTTGGHDTMGKDSSNRGMNPTPTSPSGFELNVTNQEEKSTGEEDDDDDDRILFQTKLSDARVLNDPRVNIQRKASIVSFMGTTDKQLLRRNSIRSMESGEIDVELLNLVGADITGRNGESYDDYDDLEEEEERELNILARRIFHAWDVSGDWIISTEEIVQCSGLDEEFALSLGRVLQGAVNTRRNLHDWSVPIPTTPTPPTPVTAVGAAVNITGTDPLSTITTTGAGAGSASASGIIVQDLMECLRTLTKGSLAARVNLFVRFIDVDHNASISYEEVKKYLKVLGNRSLENLGFKRSRPPTPVRDMQSQSPQPQQQQQQQQQQQAIPSKRDNDGQTYASVPAADPALAKGQEGKTGGEEGEEEFNSLSAHQVLQLFQNSSRGEAAISIFCDHILNLLKKRADAVQQQLLQQQQNASASALRRISTAFMGVGGGAAAAAQSSSQRQDTATGRSASTNALGSRTRSASGVKPTGSSTAAAAAAVGSSSGGGGGGGGGGGCIEQLRAWVMRKHSGLNKESVLYYALTVLQIMFWLINFFYYYTNDYPAVFAIAKGFGLNLRVITMALYFTMMRRVMGYLFTFRTLAPLIPVGFNIQIHSFLGFSCVLHGFGHMLGHIAYHSHYIENGFLSTFSQKSLLRGNNWADPDKWGSGDAITGFALLFILLCMATTALLRGKSSTHYRIFFLTHFGYLLWPALVFLHVPLLWPYFLVITALIVGERLYDALYMTTISTLKTSRPCNNGVTFLSVPRRKETYPGSYYRIKIPSISQLEWHPFSLASGVHSHQLTFFVASTGDWTKQLHRIVSDPEERDATLVHVQGPFYAPAKTATHFSQGHASVLVASGIGITPFFSVMATKVADEASHEADRDLYKAMFQEELHTRGGSISAIRALKNCSPVAQQIKAEDVQVLRVIWMIRDCGELLFYLDYVYELVKNQHALGRGDVVFVDVYLTGLGKSSDPSQMVAQTLFMLAIADKTSRYMNIHYGRPDLKRILHGVKPDKVYYCGGTLVQNMLTTICREVDAEFHPEDFDAGTTIVPRIERVLAAWKKSALRESHKKKKLQEKTHQKQQQQQQQQQQQ